MMKITAVACLMTVVAGCAYDRFSLVDMTTGKEAGQFTYRTGAEVRLGGNTYQIRKIGSEESAIEQYLKMTIVPDVDMCSANALDVLHFLSVCLVEYGPTNTAWTSMRPNIQLDVSRENPPDIPLVTIAGVSYVSVYECLKRFCKQTGCRLSIDGQYVWLKPTKSAAQPSAPLPRAPQQGHSDGERCR